MAPASQTINYDELWSTTLANYRATLEDNISKMNAVYWKIKKSKSGYKTVSEIGTQYSFPLMYAVGKADSYSGYDQLDVSPTAGITQGRSDWVQASIPICISGKEQKQNTGKEQLVDLLEAKMKQAEIGIQEFFGAGLLQGNGPNSATDITTAYTSPNNGSTFVTPLPALVHYTPSTSLSVCGINQNTYDWWRNQTKAATDSNYALFLGDLRSLYNTVSKYGQKPNLHVTDQLTYELYERALAASHQNPSYQKADIPFDNIAFKGEPVTWDDLVPDVANGTITSIPVAASGTWYMLNTDYIQIRVHSGTNFSSTGFVRPENQDAKVALLLWMGTIAITNRRCQGVLGSINTALTS